MHYRIVEPADPDPARVVSDTLTLGSVTIAKCSEVVSDFKVYCAPFDLAEFAEHRNVNASLTLSQRG